MKFWDWKKNKNIDPEITYLNEVHKAYFKCEKGHANFSRCKYIHERLNECLFCKKNHLAVFENEKMMKEWDWEENNKVNIFPEFVMVNSTKTVNFICDNGHKYQRPCVEFNKIKNNSPCFYCLNRKVYERNCLSIFPEIAREYDQEKNGKHPNQVKINIEEKVWWKCYKKEHEWQATIINRTCNKTGCPFCANHKVCEDNSLATLFPDIAKELDPENELTADQLIATTQKKVKWICSIDSRHKWITAVDQRTKDGAKCHYCMHQKFLPEDSIGIICPEILKFLDDSEIDVYSCSAGSGKNIKLKCEKGHKYSRRIESILRYGPDCKICNPSSLGEKETYKALALYFSDNIIKSQIEFPCSVNLSKFGRIDFKIAQNNKICFIEFNGIQHYQPTEFGNISVTQEQTLENFKHQQLRDQELRDYCHLNHFNLIEIDGRKPYSKIKSFLEQQLVILGYQI